MEHSQHCNEQSTDCSRFYFHSQLISGLTLIDLPVCSSSRFLCALVRAASVFELRDRKNRTNRAALARTVQNVCSLVCFLFIETRRSKKDGKIMAAKTMEKSMFFLLIHLQNN